MVQFSFRFACYHVIAVKLHTENNASSCFFWKLLVAVKKAGLNVEDVQSGVASPSHTLGVALAKLPVATGRLPR